MGIINEWIYHNHKRNVDEVDEFVAETDFKTP